MARFKKKMRKSRRNYFGRSVSRKGGSSGLSVTDVLIGGALYGALRPKAVQMLPDFFTFGPVNSDNVILGGAGYLLSKQSNKILKATGMMAMATEAGVVTANLTSGLQQTSSGSYVYG